MFGSPAPIYKLRFSTHLAMLLLLSEELRGHVLMQLDPWALLKAYGASSNMVPAHVTATHAAALQRLQPEVRLQPDIPLGSILQMLVAHVTDPIMELDRHCMKFPAFADEVFANVHILGRHQQHNISRKHMLRALHLPESTAPTMTECSGGACLAIGIDVLSRFAYMYPNDQRAQAAVATLRLGSYSYEVFRRFWATDDVAFLHFQVCGIAGIVCFVVRSSDSSGSTDEAADLYVRPVPRQISEASDDEGSD